MREKMEKKGTASVKHALYCTYTLTVAFPASQHVHNLLFFVYK